MRPILALIVSCLCVGSVTADPPVAQYLFPAGGQCGTTVKFHVGGLYLNKSCTMAMLGTGVTASPTITRTPSPWFEGSLLPIPESQRQEDYPRAMAASVQIAADAKGDRLVVCRTAQGITTPLKFVVGSLPEVVEVEKEGDPVPVLVTAPVTVNGRIFPREDTDIWSVVLKKGQTLSCLVDADRIGSPLEAKLELRDPDGKRLAEAFPVAGRDPRARLTATQDGVYQVHITDARADGGPAFVYRLTLTTAAVIDRVYPLGGPRGQNITVETFGSQGTTKETVRVPTDGPLEAFPFDMDTLPEVLEQDTGANVLPTPGIANGRIRTPSEVDRWSFTAKKGDSVEIELRAAQLGSPLLGVLSIHDGTGKELAKAEPGVTLDPTLKFITPADGPYVVAVQDRFRKRGGEAFAYRLRVTHPRDGFTLSYTLPTLTVTRGMKTPLKLTAKRTGTFNGPIALRVEGLPSGVTVPANLVLQAGQANMDIQLSADATAKLADAKVRVLGTALVPFTPFTAMPIPMTRTATLTDDASCDHVLLAVAIPTPFKIVGDYELKLIPRGTVHTRKYRIERNGFTGPIEIDMADRQARHLQGVTGPVLQIPGDKSEFEYPITLPPWMETGRTCRVCVMGTATMRDVDGTEHVVSYSSREQNDQIIAVVEPERLGLVVDQQTIRAEPGTTVSVPFRVLRGEGLKGPATVNAILPADTKGVTVPAATVAEKGEHGKLTFTFAADQLLPARVTITLRATVLDNGRPVTAEKQLDLLPAR